MGHRKIQRAGKSFKWHWASLTVCAVVAVAAIAPSASGGTKKLYGELQCAPGEKVTGIWMLGSKSGWHGFNYPNDWSKQPYVGRYEIDAVEGETIKHWIRCSVFGETYGSFVVGRGSTRHICSGALGGPCISVGFAGCVLQRIAGLKITILGCILRNGR